MNQRKFGFRFRREQSGSHLKGPGYALASACVFMMLLTAGRWALCTDVFFFEVNTSGSVGGSPKRGTGWIAIASSNSRKSCGIAFNARLSNQPAACAAHLPATAHLKKIMCLADTGFHG